MTSDCAAIMRSCDAKLPQKNSVMPEEPSRTFARYYIPCVAVMIVVYYNTNKSGIFLIVSFSLKKDCQVPTPCACHKMFMH